MLKGNDLLYFFKQVAVLLLGFLFTTYQESLAQVPDSAQQVYWQACHAKINALAPSHTGTTDLGNTYQLIAIKYQKDWLFVVSDSLNYDSYFKFHKQDTLRQNSLFFDNNLCRLVEMYLEPASKPKETIFGELVLKEYYTVKQEGKKFYEQIAAAEAGRNYPGFFSKVAKVAFLPIDKLFGIEKMADMKKAVEAQKKAIEDKVKEVQDIKKQTEALKKTLEEQQKENEALKAELAAYQKPEWEEEENLLAEEANKSDTLQNGKTNVVLEENTYLVKIDSTQNPEDIAVLPIDSLKKINPNDSLTTDSTHYAPTEVPQVKDSTTLAENTSPIDSLPQDNSLENQKAALQNKINEKSDGKGAEVVLQLPEDIEADKRRRDQIVAEKKTLSEALSTNEDPQESKEIAEKLKQLDEELMVLLDRLGRRLKEEKEKLEKEKS